MEFIFGKQELCTLERAQEKCVLLTNGLGGYASVTAAWSVNRCDQGILVAATTAPNVRLGLVHRMRETLRVGERTCFLSTQSFAGRGKAEEGFRQLSRFRYDGVPEWVYDVEGVEVTRTLALAHGENTAAVRYEIRNNSGKPCALTLEPFLKFAPKEDALQEKRPLAYRPGEITDGTWTLRFHTNGKEEKRPLCWQTLSYAEDARDGRPAKGLCGCCCRIQAVVAEGGREVLEVVFSLEETFGSAGAILTEARQRQKRLENDGGFRDPVARTLAAAADAFLARRDSTGGMTILAGYPLFSDWGRDTMISLPGCALATGRFAEARSILRTFLSYEKDGLVPNLFPEGGREPMYNTVDAALLLIDCVWQYTRRTGDMAFAREAWPVLERIAAAYRRGTCHGISMDSDGLIRAGEGLDQVTWMDVCVNGILPTPRHGKPVEVNAYWYNALRILDALARELGEDPRDYGTLADRVRTSFREKFYMEDRGYLRDVLSGTGADEQLRCNQIWAVSMSFTMLTAEEEKNVVQAVERSLYTPCGLRTLSPEDPEYRGFYGGAQVDRDMAYHQGTVWVFPLGAYYRACLKINGNSPEAVRQVRGRLAALEPMLREGCLGQLPEIYDGDMPAQGKGCFAQAWSVGEMLRLYEALESAPGEVETRNSSPGGTGEGFQGATLRNSTEEALGPAGHAAGRRERSKKG